MPTTPNMNLALPTEGGSADTWDTILNAALGVGGVDDHDHTTGKGVKIPSAALKINADVAWSYSGTSYAITAIAAVDFAAVTAASVAGYAGALFVNSSDSNNLYFRTIGGTNVKITDGTTLNVSIVGGIGGDYSSVSALLDYDDASDTYSFRQETASAVRQYAKLSSADIIVREYKAAGVTPVPSNAVTIKSPAALAASYSITLPAAVPGAAVAMQMDATGGISLGNSFASSLEAPSFEHTGTLTLIVPGAMSADPNGSHTKLLSAAGSMVGWTIAASTNKITYPIPLKDGDIITAYRLYVDKQTSNANTIACRLYSYDGAGGGETALETGDTDNSNAPGGIVMGEPAIEISCASGTQYYLRFLPGSGVAPSNDAILHLEVDYVRVV